MTTTAQNLTTGTTIEIDGRKWAVLLFVDAAYNLTHGHHQTEEHAEAKGCDVLYVQAPKGRRVFSAAVCRKTGRISNLTLAY